MRLLRITSLSCLLLALSMPAASSAAEPSEQTYGPVAPKEILSLIAQKVRGEYRIPLKDMIHALRELNPDAFSSSGNLMIGSTLIIPDLDSLSKTVPNLLSAPQTPPEDTRFFAEEQPEKKAVVSKASMANEINAEPDVVEVAQPRSHEFTTLEATPETLTPETPEITASTSAIDNNSSNEDEKTVQSTRLANELADKLHAATAEIELLTAKIEASENNAGQMQTELEQLKHQRSADTSRIHDLEEQTRSPPITPDRSSSEITFHQLINSSIGQQLLGVLLAIILLTSIVFLLASRRSATTITPIQDEAPPSNYDKLTDFGFSPAAPNEFDWDESDETREHGHNASKITEAEPAERRAIDDESFELEEEINELEDLSDPDDMVDLDDLTAPHDLDDIDEHEEDKAAEHSDPISKQNKQINGDDKDTAADSTFKPANSTQNNEDLTREPKSEYKKSDPTPDYEGSDDVTIINAKNANTASSIDEVPPKKSSNSGPEETRGLPDSEDITILNTTTAEDTSTSNEIEFTPHADTRDGGPDENIASDKAGVSLSPEKPDATTLSTEEAESGEKDDEMGALSTDDHIIEDKISFAYLHLDMGNFHQASASLDEIDVTRHPKFADELNKIRQLLDNELQSSMPTEDANEDAQNKVLKHQLKLATGYMSQNKPEAGKVYIAKIMENGTADYKEKALVLLQQAERIIQSTRPDNKSSNKINFQDDDNTKTIMTRQKDSSKLTQRDKPLEKTQPLEYHDIIPLDISTHFEEYKQDEDGTRLALAYLFLDIRETDSARQLLQETANGANPDMAKEATWVLNKLQSSA